MVTRLSRVAFASECGIDSTLLSRLEHCVVPLRYSSAWKITTRFEIDVTWLATGKSGFIPDLKIPSPGSIHLSGNELFSSIFDTSLSIILQQLKSSEINRAAEIWFRFEKPSLTTRVLLRDWIFGHVTDWCVQLPDNQLRLFAEEFIKNNSSLVASLGIDPQKIVEARSKEMMYHRIKSALFRESESQEIYQPDEQVSLDKVSQASKIDVMSDTNVSLWGRLRAKICALTSERGSKSALARQLNVTRQAVSEWIDGSTSPTAETTLRLLKWVEQQEEQQKSSGSALTHPEPKTRQEKLNEYSKSNPKEE